MLGSESSGVGLRLEPMQFRLREEVKGEGMDSPPPPRVQGVELGFTHGPYPATPLGYLILRHRNHAEPPAYAPLPAPPFWPLGSHPHPIPHSLHGRVAQGMPAH